MSPPIISCIILSGGEAKRMDRVDKGLVNYRGELLIHHVIQKISPQVDDIIISANRNLDEYKKLNYPVIEDSIKDYSGPLAGISSAASLCKHDYLLIVPCDMPLLPDNLVNKMTTSKVFNVISIHNEVQLVFLLHKNVINSINQYLDDGHHKVMTWVHANNPNIIDMTENETCFANINSDKDLTGH